MVYKGVGLASRREGSHANSIVCCYCDTLFCGRFGYRQCPRSTRTRRDNLRFPSPWSQSAARNEGILSAKIGNAGLSERNILGSAWKRQYGFGKAQGSHHDVRSVVHVARTIGRYSISIARSHNDRRKRTRRFTESALITQWVLDSASTKTAKVDWDSATPHGFVGRLEP
jgi:hypothetical protein